MASKIRENMNNKPPGLPYPSMMNTWVTKNKTNANKAKKPQSALLFGLDSRQANDQPIFGTRQANNQEIYRSLSAKKSRMYVDIQMLDEIMSGLICVLLA